MEKTDDRIRLIENLVCQGLDRYVWHDDEYMPTKYYEMGSANEIRELMDGMGIKYKQETNYHYPRITIKYDFLIHDVHTYWHAFKIILDDV